MYITPSIFNSGKIIAAQSTREGGVSPAPYSSLNLGMSVKDDPGNVLKNRELFFSALGIKQEDVTKSHQVHGIKVLIVNGPVTTEGYDGLISNRPGVFLAVSVADCTPVLIHDEKNNAVAALHAGWRGTAGGIVTEAMNLMGTAYGTKGRDCKAFIGACISHENFEVGEEVAAQFSNSVKTFQSLKGKWFIDLKGANRNLLIAAGVPEENIETCGLCTVADNDRFFSHRKENGLTGRMMAVIGIRKT
ncbi:MAG TPA: peptidoglycan editing factor PgeF [Bacteroidia bacterium]|jgi:hypothetical protein